MIKFNLLTEKKENVIYEEELTNIFFDGLRDGEYGFIIKMDNNNNGLLHWETNNDLSVEPIAINDISFNYERETIRVGNFNYPGKLNGELTFEYFDNIISKMLYNNHKPVKYLDIILITLKSKIKLIVTPKDIQTRDELQRSNYEYDFYRKKHKINFIIENYETII